MRKRSGKKRERIHPAAPASATKAAGIQWREKTRAHPMPVAKAAAEAKEAVAGEEGWGRRREDSGLDRLSGPGMNLPCPAVGGQLPEFGGA